MKGNDHKLRKNGMCRLATGQTPRTQQLDIMASGDSFLNTLTIDGRYDRSSNLRKFKDPLFFIRLPQNLVKGGLWKGRTQANPRRQLISVSQPRRRGQSLPPLTGRAGLTTSPDLASPAHRCGAGPIDGAGSTQGDLGPTIRAHRLLAALWLPVCFAVINAVCYAIEPATGSLMMTSSTLLLHHMGVVGRGLTIIIFMLASASLLLHGSDMIYIMAVHALYYSAVCMGRSCEEQYARTKRPYRKK
ncbi:hypothetical protein RRG08_005843 [Elysia crispata]|uniref:Uncharacterized protein n=1 Tax=Elysia crispata TaxID=231223 RepID=A0AAE1E9K9_9GAST|nr:hypothetical protein RRG08_005843 [Elysia crispata]